MDPDTLAPLERFVISWVESMSWDYLGQVPDIVVDSLRAWIERSNFVRFTIKSTMCSVAVGDHVLVETSSS